MNTLAVVRYGQQRDWEAKYYKCHVCQGSYNKTAEHAKQQGKGAEESNRVARQGRGAGRGPGQGNRARQQGSGAGEQGKVAGQGRGAGQQGRARQQGRAASEGRTFVKKYVDFLTSS